MLIWNRYTSCRFLFSFLLVRVHISVKSGNDKEQEKFYLVREQFKNNVEGS
jgi:hypothetical protein